MLTLVRRARRRLFQNELLAQGATAISAALLAFILLLLLGTEVLIWYWAVLLPLVAISFGFYRARKHVPTPYGVAQIVDSRLNLADTLSTAMFFSQDTSSPKVSADVRRLQSERADRLSETIDLRQAVPYVLPRTFYAMAALLLVASSLFALRYGFHKNLDLKPPVAHILQQMFGGQQRPEEARAARRLHQPDPETEPDEGSPADQNADNKGGDQQDTQQAKAEEPGDSKSPAGEQKASNDSQKQQQEEGDKAEGDPKDGKGDQQHSSDGENPGNGQQANAKSDQKQDAQSKQDANGAGESSSLMSKFKDAMQNLLSKMKPQQGQSGSQQQQASANQKNSQSKGQQSAGKQQQGKDGQQQNGQQGDSQDGQSGEQAQNAQDQQAKGNGKSDSQQPNKQPGNGVGSQDGDKSIKQAEQLAAMGKISEIYGKRSATISGESSVEVQNTNQQLKTPYAQRSNQHAQGGSEINRDEIPVALQNYVEKYFEQVRKQKK